jgi:hypothetical protein
MGMATGPPSANCWRDFKPPPHSPTTHLLARDSFRPQITQTGHKWPVSLLAPRDPADPLDRQATKSGTRIFAATKLLCSVLTREGVLLLNGYSSSLPQDRYELARPPRFVVLEYC